VLALELAELPRLAELPGLAEVDDKGWIIRRSFCWKITVGGGMADWVGFSARPLTA